MTADGGLIAATGEAYDSGRGAFCVRFGFFYESDSFIFWFLDHDILEGQRVINFQGTQKLSLWNF